MIQYVKYIVCVSLMILAVAFFTDNSIAIDAETKSNSSISVFPIENTIRHPDDKKSDLSYQEITDVIYTIDMGDGIFESLSKNTVEPLIYQFDGSLYIDYEKCKEYVIGLVSKYDTYGKPRLFKTSDNQTIKIIQQ